MIKIYFQRDQELYGVLGIEMIVHVS